MHISHLKYTSKTNESEINIEVFILLCGSITTLRSLAYIRTEYNCLKCLDPPISHTVL